MRIGDEYSDASCNSFLGRVLMYYYKVVNGCLSKVWILFNLLSLQGVPSTEIKIVHS